MQEIKIKRQDSDWEIHAYLKEDRESKFLVWDSTSKNIELHFPKPEYYYEKLNKEES